MQKICGKYPQIKGNLAKNEGNRFLVFRPPFFAEKWKIEKSEKWNFFRFGATHTYNLALRSWASLLVNTFIRHLKSLTSQLLIFSNFFKSIPINWPTCFLDISCFWLLLRTLNLRIFKNGFNSLKVFVSSMTSSLAPI